MPAIDGGKSEDLVAAREERGLGACAGRARTWCLRGKSEDLVLAREERGLGACEERKRRRKERGRGACE